MRPACTALVLAALAAPAPIGAGSGQAAPPAAGDCVAIGAPKPNLTYVYRQTESTGNASEFSNRWESFTATGSRLHTTKNTPRGRGTLTTVTEHHVTDDLLMIDRQTDTGTEAGARINNTTSFQRPGVVGGPAKRACRGRLWNFRAVTVTHHQSGGGPVSAQSEPGTLRVIDIRESVTVPAGRFDTVHYLRTVMGDTGRSLDEYWLSIEHGVMVKRNHTLPNATVAAVLQAIK
jgi:hypothetical protein